MPGLYAERTFDLAGTIIGVVEEDQAIHGNLVTPGDVLVAYASSGLHTNGYTLARRVLLEDMGLSLSAVLPGTDIRVVDALLAVHRSYYAAIQPVLSVVHGLAHITGGGIGGNLVRILPEDCAALVDATSWQWPALFTTIADRGRISTAEMRDVFNLGIGMIACVPASAADRLHTAGHAAGVATWNCGAIGAGTRRVEFRE
jgi:phosphoribosylformylglycinamidine cyclo-ligase